MYSFRLPRSGSWGFRSELSRTREWPPSWGWRRTSGQCTYCLWEHHSPHDRGPRQTNGGNLNLHYQANLANETIWMMEGGFASGAMARWRTLHEVAVIAFFLRQHGQGAAERYLLHEAIESHKATSQYQQYCTQLGREPLDAATLR